MSLAAHEITSLMLALATILGCARILGEIARRFNQPSVLGEILAGILLGPTILGRFAPEFQGFLFPTTGNTPVALEGFFIIAVTLFLLVAGMEVDLSAATRSSRAAINISVLGMVIPFSVGFAFAWGFPDLLGGYSTDSHLVFALFFATALAISALPVIAKTLKDLNLLKTDLGMIVLAAAIVDDLTGWVVFAVVLGLSGVTKGLEIKWVIMLTLLFVVLMLTVVRWMVHRLLPLVQAHMSWPAGVLGFALTGAFLCGAVTEFIGIHAIFGAFFFGIALGDSDHLKQRTRATLDQFISFIFAPIFFGSIGLKVDFAANFDVVVVVVVLILAIVGKMTGCYWGAQLSGLSKRESWAIGYANNARGSMEIILGLLALQYGLIGETLFVALVVMALVTSMMSGTMIQSVLKRSKKIEFQNFLRTHWFKKPIQAVTSEEAIRELSALLAPDLKMPAEQIAEAVWQRELTMPTGLPGRVAIPHARIEGLKSPMIALGISPEGVDFNSPDGRHARLIFMILTPVQDNGAQLEILASIAKVSSSEHFVSRLIASATYTEFLAHIRSREEEH